MRRYINEIENKQRGSAKTNIFFGRKEPNKISTWKNLPIGKRKVINK